MRDYLFHGKRKDNGEWVEGSLILTTSVKEKTYIVDSCYCYDECIDEDGYADFDRLNAFEVIPETVGQYTGLTDKNGKKIFEGDILEDFIGQKCAVTYESGYYYPLIAFPEFRCWSTSECAVIGNIHDNPDYRKIF